MDIVDRWIDSHVFRVFPGLLEVPDLHELALGATKILRLSRADQLVGCEFLLKPLVGLWLVKLVIKPQ